MVSTEVAKEKKDFSKISFQPYLPGQTIDSQTTKILSGLELKFLREYGQELLSAKKFSTKLIVLVGTDEYLKLAYSNWRNRNSARESVVPKHGLSLVLKNEYDVPVGFIDIIQTTDQPPVILKAFVEKEYRSLGALLAIKKQIRKIFAQLKLERLMVIFDKGNKRFEKLHKLLGAEMVPENEQDIPGVTKMMYLAEKTNIDPIIREV